MYRDAVERKDGDADDDDQHQRHIGKNDAVRVAPERFDRLRDLCSHRIRSGGPDPRTSMEAAAWGDSGHGTLQRGAERQTHASRPIAAATRERSDECALSTHILMVIPTPFVRNAWNGHHYLRSLSKTAIQPVAAGWRTDSCYCLIRTNRKATGRTAVRYRQLPGSAG